MLIPMKKNRNVLNQIFDEHDGILKKHDFDRLIIEHRISEQAFEDLVSFTSEFAYKTTVLEAEQSIVINTKKIADKTCTVDEEQVDKFIQFLEKELLIRGERSQVLKEIIYNTCPMILLQGVPGATKSTLARYFINYYVETEKQSLKHCWVLSPFSKAVAKLKGRSRCEGTTLQDLFRQNKAGKSIIPQGSIVVVDEAGLIGTEDFAQLLILAEQGKWKRLLLLGDDKQETPKEIGQPLKLILRNLPEKSVLSLTQGFRQKNEYALKLVQNVYQGNAEDFIEALKTQDAFHFVSSKEDMQSKVVEKYFNIIKYRGQTRVDACMVACQSSHLAKKINHAVQQKLKEQKVLKSQYSLVENSMDIYEGDRIIIKKGAMGYTKNGNETKVHRGQLGIVYRIEKEKIIIALDGKPRRFYVSFKRDNLPLIRLSYAVTIRDIQGLACDNVILAITDEASGCTMVSAGSRHRHGLFLYVLSDAYSSQNDLISDMKIFPSKPILMDMVLD